MDFKSLLKPGYRRQFLLIRQPRRGDGFRIRPYDQSRQREFVPREARAGILFSQRLNIAVPKNPIGPHAMAALHVPHEFNHPFDLLLGVFSVGCTWIAAVAGIDDLNADRTRIQMAVTLPKTRSRM